MDGRDGMRAADADRQETAERLRVALEEGRIDLYEYDERLQRAYGAKTYGELAGVLADLPGPAPVERSGVVPRQPEAEPAVSGVTPHPVVSAGGGTTAGWLVEAWLPWLRVAAILTAIWLFSSLGSRHLAYFWPIWALGPWGAVLLFRTAGGLATGAPGRDAERRARRRAERHERRRARRSGRR
ncbi:DUF1707 domain-containing protein [Micromonospora mangrovi]|uniref:DUF1707 domain-containing protein n=2 Tax=Micromonospora TaxID=1873 RepID=A0AAU8HF22_9ACTN